MASAARLMLVREVPPGYGAESIALDRIEDLGDEIATLAAHISAATHRMLVLIAEFDELRGWELSGQRSCAHWLALRTGFDLGSAREKVRTARALVGLPETSAAMARGELSFSKVRALSRVATPENEADLLELARGCTTAQLERAVRGWRRAGNRKDEAALEHERHEARSLAVFPDLDGMYVVHGKLPPELGALLMRAIEAASDHIYREQPHEARETEQAATQRRADALALLAERALSAGLGDAPVSGTRAERYQVVVHVDEATLQAEAQPGRSELDDGTRVSAETSRRLSCDAGLLRMRHAPDGTPLDLGRRTRTVSPALRRARGARPRMPLPRLRLAVHRWASRAALGRRRRDQPPEHAAPVPAPSHARARGRLARRVVGRRPARVPRAARSDRLRGALAAARAARGSHRFSRC
ncbi:MAG: DUF222 domain-containing protein [Gemmatimonadota bacterium]